jgi:hypothetical protein
LAESARSLRWPHLKYARYSRFGRLEIAPIALKNPSARAIQQAVSAIALTSACSAEVLNIGTNNPDNADGNPACDGVSTTPQLLFRPDADESVAIDSLKSDGQHVYLLQRSLDLADRVSEPSATGAWPTLARVPVSGGARTLLGYDSNTNGAELALDANHVYTVTGEADTIVKRRKTGQQIASIREPVDRRIDGRLVANAAGWLAWRTERRTVLLKNPGTEQISEVENGVISYSQSLLIDDFHLYYTIGTEGQLHRMNLRDGTIEQLGQALSRPQVDEQQLYGHTSQGEIASRRINSEVWRVIFTNAPVFDFVQLSGDCLYWVGWSDGSSRTRGLWRGRKDGTGTRELLQRDLGRDPRLAIDACRIYWTRETALGQVVESRRK